MLKAISLNTDRTIKDVLDSHKGVAPGFHFLRYALASAIFIFHSYFVVKGQSAGAGYSDLTNAVAVAQGLSPPASPPTRSLVIEALRPGLFSLVAAFFAVSGFLVLGSAKRLASVPVFLAFRGLRIFPALAVETLLSALLLGPAITTLTLGDYFTDPIFWRYFGNIVGWVSFFLPGVFLTNPVSSIVNINLWTLPGEFYCYLIMALIMGSRIAYSGKSWIVGTLAGTAIFALIIVFGFAKTRANNTHFTTSMIVYYFFIGGLFYEFAGKIPLKISLFFTAVLAFWAITFFNVGDLLAPVFLTYAAVFIGCQAYPLFDKLVRGDYSYGIYLYGFPLQQAFIFMFPEHRSMLWVVTVAGTATIMCAMMSWFLVEKPALKLKSFVRKPTKGRS